MRNADYDCFHVSPFSHTEMFCGVCNSKMDLIPHDPNKYKGGGMGASILRAQYNFDEFICPNSNLDWHSKAKDLMHAIVESPSPSLQELMRKDLQVMLAKHS